MVSSHLGTSKQTQFPYHKPASIMLPWLENYLWTAVLQRDADSARGQVQTYLGSMA